jgi:Na+-driven multidrug efflux pump
MGIVGVWIAMTIDELIRAAIFIVRLKRGSWKKRNLVVNN